MKKMILGLALASLTTGCATVMTQDQQTIDITTSNDSSFEVVIDDKKIMAPGMVTVLRDGKEKVVTTTHAKCDDVTPIKKTVNPTFFGNLIIGGLYGSTTDNVTGKMWDYADTVEVQCDTQP